jgi:two-component sensor histidine kinase
MHPLFADARHMIWYVVAWLFIANVAAAAMAANGAAGHLDAWLFCVPVCVLFGFVAMSAYYVCRSQPLARRRLPRLITLYGMTSLVSGVLLDAIARTWLEIGASVGAGWGSLAAIERAPFTIFGLGAGAYLLSILTHDVFIAMDNLRLSELRERESRTLAREAELQLLRMQINPHFLFNSLNSISALTSIDAAAARAMTIALAQFFRQTLALADQEKILLVTELALCESFLAVEKIRFGAKLQANLQTGEDTLQAIIPPMILQPLLENAVKHGIRTLAEGGTIDARVTHQGGWLHIMVENPTDPDALKQQGTGTGLENIRRRCTTLYDNRARVEWGSNTPGRFTVTLTLPFESNA